MAVNTSICSGASKGIGRSIALNLATRGCSILGTCSSKESLQLIDILAKSITEVYEKAPGISESKIYGLAADITTPNCATLIADGLEANFGGRIDILVNNAAITGGIRIGQTTPEQAHKMLFANVQTPVMLVNELVKRKMFRPGSRIVNISSDRARVPSNESLIYSATKAALESLARSWAKALGGTDEAYAFMAGTTANSVSVGVTESDAVKSMMALMPPEIREKLQKEELSKQLIAPAGQRYFAQCEEVADVVGMLCSKEARWMTGSIIPANGGAVMIL